MSLPRGIRYETLPERLLQGKAFPQHIQSFLRARTCVCRVHTCLCVQTEPCVCVRECLRWCEYFMTLSASLSNCTRFICVHFIFFLNAAASCVWEKFSCTGILFFRAETIYSRLSTFIIKFKFNWTILMYFQFYIADMRIADGKENVWGIKKNVCIVRFQVDTFFFNPFIEGSACVSASGVGAKGLGTPKHIKMITHRKTAAFMVFLYFLKVFIIEARSNTSVGKCIFSCL